MLIKLTERLPARKVLLLQLGLLSFCLFNPVFAKGQVPVKLHWLGGKAPFETVGVSWGVPFPQGAVPKGDDFILTNELNQPVKQQSWPLAYWPDGSMKWIGLGAVVPAGTDSLFYLKTAHQAAATQLQPLVHEDSEVFTINTGKAQCVVPKSGSLFIKSLRVDGKEVALDGRLVCSSQIGVGDEFGIQPDRESYISTIDTVTLEQNGSVRAVLKIEGRHRAVSGSRVWLPFILRLYFYQGIPDIRIVHTLIYDGDQESDFIRGLAMVFDVPLRDTLYNRHVRLSGDDVRLWDEPVQPLKGRYPFSRRGDEQDWYAIQLEGKRLLPKNEYTEEQQFLIDHLASWNDFKLTQLDADGFRVKKRTNGQSAWIDAGAGHRSDGLAFVGDVSGGLAVCMRDFWQSFPSALEVRDAKSDTAEMRLWLWSPDAEAMDMRHYDTIPHDLIASYEDVQAGFSLATGVGRTTEFIIHPSADVPSYETLKALADRTNNPPLLTVQPEYIHQIPVLGIWSLPDLSTPSKRWLEDQLDKAFAYYKLEVEQRHWYGFWDYGDIMHAYDPDRHVWMYDVGGFAWDNTELMPNLWLWYSYLRSGREDIFRMAEALTRHTGEVDVYHLGRFEGLGSRHNVRHWGCGAKEVRISQAVLGRFYYYLTTDERTGDLMQASVEASNRAIGEYDPLRLILDKGSYPTHVRVGPDWLALVGNWMTAWERTGDIQYRERIMKGINSLANMPYGFFSGKNAAFGYDPSTFRLYQLHKTDVGSAHLAVLMGGPEVAFELANLLNDKKWNKLWFQFCRLYAAPEQEIEKELGVKAELGKPGAWYSRLSAYWYKQSGDEKYAKRAWDMFMESQRGQWKTSFDTQTFDGVQSLAPVKEVRGVSTNHTAQWCLNAIELLELVGDQIPESLKEEDEE